MKNFLNIFKKGKEKKSNIDVNSLTYNIQNSWNEKIEEISINFFDSKRIEAAKGNINLPPFEEFLDNFNNIILNNKSKQGFSKGEALKKTGEKLKNDMLYMLSNLLIYPAQLISILKRQKDQRYYIFSDLITEESLDKTLKIVSIIKEYLDTRQKYKEITEKPVRTIFLNFYLQWILLSLVMVLILPYMIIDKQMISKEALIAKRPEWELGLTSMFLGLSYPTFIVKLIFFTEIVIFFWGLAWIVIYLFKFIFTFLSETRKREADKIIDELYFIYYVKIKIEKLYLGTIKLADGTIKNHYLNVRYIDFLIEMNNEAYNKWLVSYSFNKELSRVLTLFLATKNKVLNRNWSEFFYNQLDLILTGYQAWINWTNYNFNLDYIKEKFTDAQITLKKIFLDAHEKTISLIGTVMLLLTLTIVGLSSLYQFKQSDSLWKAMKYDMEAQK